MTADEHASEPASWRLSPPEHVDVLRIVDAAANRALEGLRVLEDYLRFALDDAHLTLLAKQLRHELSAVLSGIASQRHAARDTLSDVGTALTTPTESIRADLASVPEANLRRVLEALRSLEEYFKILDPAVSTKLEALRYRAYTLERAVGITHASMERLATTRLYVLVDGRISLEEFATLVESLLGAGIQAIQLRDKLLPDRELISRARLLAPRTRDAGALFIVNGRRINPFDPAGAAGRA
jgi:thiamine-phosphate pyrophosphorylase